MQHVKWLALLPFAGVLGGAFVLNRATPLVMGMPLLLAWLVLCVVLTSAIMGVIYLCDPANRPAVSRHDGGPRA